MKSEELIKLKEKVQEIKQKRDKVLEIQEEIKKLEEKEKNEINTFHGKRRIVNEFSFKETKDEDNIEIIQEIKEYGYQYDYETGAENAG